MILNKTFVNLCCRRNSEAGLDNMGRRFEEKRRAPPRPDLIENAVEARACDSVSEKSMDLSSPEEAGAEIAHLPGQINADELYAVPVKRRAKPAEQKPLLAPDDDEDETEESLPLGWEKHEGN